MLKQWIMDNVVDFKDSVHTEEDMKIKVLLPYLNSLGYSSKELKIENGMDVTIGAKRIRVCSDIAVVLNGKVEMVINAKRPRKALSEKDLLQVVNYAKLISVPQAMYGVVCNGVDCIATDTYTGKRFVEIPTKPQLLRAVDKAKKQVLNEADKREVESVLFTLHNSKELYKVIQDSKEVIERRALIRSDQSFREMTKILLVKMNEERRVRANEGNNRFNKEYLSARAKCNKVEELTVFKELFEEAKKKYPNIYTDESEQINITDNVCICHIIKELEPFSFLGTGDDIKGTVYEIFLKSMLRGEFDQYFTPREIVEFMVKCADPNIGDVVLDPACGSGGFLIQVFNYVNAKINASNVSEVENNNRYRILVDKCLWGHEADYDLHVLAKINLIMHGDGWNNIYQGDTLSSNKLPDNYFDVVLANPPFTIPYAFKDILQKYELGFDKETEELDILFVEKSLYVLKEGCDLYIVLPEGLLNNKKYLYFREWLLHKADLLMSISLPEGAFIPFGGSVSKTCILGLRKKAKDSSYGSPNYVFLGTAKEIGYQLGKKNYRSHTKNDFAEFEYMMNEIFIGLQYTSNGAECGWIEQNKIHSYRMDANYLLNKIDRESMGAKYGKVVPLKEVCRIENESVTVKDDVEYYYLEVPDISPQTGTITNIRRVKGSEIGDSFHKFYAGDILFTRINPRISRVAIVPDIEEFGLVSKEVYRIVYKKNKYIKEEYKYVICALLQNVNVTSQIVRLSTGSSSSRARVQVGDLLNDVYIPILDEKKQKQISDSIYSSNIRVWRQAQNLLKIFEENQRMLGSKINKNDFRGI